MMQQVNFLFSRDCKMLSKDKAAFVLLDGDQTVQQALHKLCERGVPRRSWGVDPEQLQILYCLKDLDSSGPIFIIYPEDKIAETITDTCYVVVGPGSTTATMERTPALVGSCVGAATRSQAEENIDAGFLDTINAAMEAETEDDCSFLSILVANATPVSVTASEDSGHGRSSRTNNSKRRTTTGNDQGHYKKARVSAGGRYVRQQQSSKVGGSTTNNNSLGSSENERSFEIGSRHFSKYYDGIEYPCRIVAFHEHKSHPYCIKYEKYSSRYMVDKRQLLPCTPARERAYQDACRRAKEKKEKEKQKQLAAKLKRKQTKQARKKKQSAVSKKRLQAKAEQEMYGEPISTKQLFPDYADEAFVGILVAEPDENRRVYVAAEDETPFQIAKRFGADLNRLLYDNRCLHPQIGRHTKLKKLTALVLPL